MKTTKTMKATKTASYLAFSALSAFSFVVLSALVALSTLSTLSTPSALGQSQSKVQTTKRSAASPALALSANDEIFKVLASKGKITLQRTKKPLSVGTALNGADQIKLEGSCYLGLVHKSGKAIEHRSAGTVSVADLLKLVPAPQSSLDKLVGFVMQSLTDAKKTNGKTELSGGVERSVGGLHEGSEGADGLLAAGNRVRPLLPRTTKLDIAGADSLVRFCWTRGKAPRASATPTSPQSPAPTYALTLTDALGTMRFKQETPDTAFTLNLKELGLSAGTCYYWTVIPVAPAAEQASQQASAQNTAEFFEQSAARMSYCLYLAKPDEALVLGSEERELAAQNAAPASTQAPAQAALQGSLQQQPLLALMNGVLYERHGFNARAYKAYRTALTTMQATSGDVSMVQAVLERFLRRVGIDDATITRLVQTQP
jgi:hypothetical protein